MTTEEIASRVQSALASGDPAALEPVLAADVWWGSCVGNSEVIDFVRRIVEEGFEVTVADVNAGPDRILVELESNRLREELSGGRRFWQTLFVRDGMVVEIRDFPDREQAAAAEPRPVPTPPSGPPTGVNRMAAIFPVRDVDTAMEHYRRLGFEVSLYEGGGYGYAERGDANFHFAEIGSHNRGSNTSAVYLYVDDADALFAEWRTAGVVGQFIEPSDTEYGLREGAHIDPAGNLIRFGSRLG